MRFCYPGVALGFAEVNARLHHNHNTRGFGTLAPEVSRWTLMDWALNG